MEGALPKNPEPRLTNYFSAPQWWIFWGCLIVGVLLRFIFLGDRPYHHDESLHGMYGRYFYDFPGTNYYKYDPMLHGPFLYNLLRLTYSTVGDSNFGARVPIALLGSLYIAVPLLFRRLITPGVCLLLVALFAFAPTFIFWSRFLREDIPVLGTLILMTYAVIAAPAAWKGALFIIGAGLLFSMKASFYVYGALLLGFLVFEFLMTTLIVRDGATPLIVRAWRNVTNHLPQALGAFVATFFIVVWLYSAGFRDNPFAIVDNRHAGVCPSSSALYCAIAGYNPIKILYGFYYWLHHHTIERIQGPFLFHFYTLSWYELPLIAAFITHLVVFYARASLPFLLAGFGIVLLSIVPLFFFPSEIVPSTVVGKFFKLKDSFDIAGLPLLLIHPVLVTTYHLLHRNRGLAFFAYFFTASFFTYSYLGEKVPWLSLYILVPGMAYLALYFSDLIATSEHKWWRSISVSTTVQWCGAALIILGLLFIVQEKSSLGEPFWRYLSLGSNHSEEQIYNLFFMVSGFALLLFTAFIIWWGNPTVHGGALLLVLFIVWQSRQIVLTNFVRAGESREYLSQVHTTHDFHKLMVAYRNLHESQISGKRPTILVTGDAVWPATWYLRDIPEYKFSATSEERGTFDFIIQDWKDPQTDVPAGYRVTKVNLRGWWVPDLREMNLKRFLNYALNRTPWNGTGYTEVALLVKDR